MNKKVLFGVFGLAAGSMMADSVPAAAFNPYVGVKGGYSLLGKKDEIKYKNGFVGAVEFGVSYDAWRLGLEVAYRQNKIKQDGTTNEIFVEGDRLSHDKINSLSGMLNVYYDYALTDECSLYLGLGLGAAKVSYADRVEKVESGKTVFAWQAKVGVAYDINENWTVEVDYCLSKTSNVRFNQQTKIKAPWSNIITAGLRYNF